MKRMKRILSLTLSMALAFSLCITAGAAVAGYTDVADDTWYAEAAAWCKDNGILNGTSSTTFAPDNTLNRYVIAVGLHRAEGKPETGGKAFSDVAADSWFGSAIRWAAGQGITTGYGDGSFRPYAPVTRQQLSAFLWRYAGKPAAPKIAFPDQDKVGKSFVTSMDWAAANEVLRPRVNGSYAPAENATRAEVAWAFMKVLQNKAETPAAQPTEPASGEDGKVLVAYFSATNNTKGVAEKIAAAVDGAVLYEIKPETPYTSADLSYGDSSSRTTKEQNDPSARPAVSGRVENMAQYDVIFLGYPIWWGQAPKIMYTFLESYDCAGKTIIPFCTSGSSGIGTSATNLRAAAPGAIWQAGQRFNGGASESTVSSWVDGLRLARNAAG